VKITDYGVSLLFAKHDIMKQHRIAWYELSIKLAVFASTECNLK